MMGDTKMTPGPWAWRKLGGQWHLLGDHSMRPIVLSRYKKGLSSLTSNHLLVPFDPRHPDAVTIAKSAEMIELVRELLKEPAHAEPCGLLGMPCKMCQFRDRMTEIIAEIDAAEESWEP